MTNHQFAIQYAEREIAGIQKALDVIHLVPDELEVYILNNQIATRINGLDQAEIEAMLVKAGWTFKDRIDSRLTTFFDYKHPEAGEVTFSIHVPIPGKSDGCS